MWKRPDEESNSTMTGRNEPDYNAISAKHRKCSITTHSDTNFPLVLFFFFEAKSFNSCKCLII